MKLHSLFKSLLFILIFSSCTNAPDQQTWSGSEADNDVEEPKTPEELRLQLEEEEGLAPLDYLSYEDVTLDLQQIKTRNAGLFRDAEYKADGGIIEGTFLNSATIAKFKDVEVKISFYSQTETLIDEVNYVIYKYSEPNSRTHFSFKIPTVPEAYDSFTFEITGATAVRE